MIWTQNYAPFDAAWLNPLAAALPVVVLLGLLASGRASAVVAALAGLACAMAAAIFVFTPKEALGAAGLADWATTVFAAAGNGAAFGLFPIGWIVLAAIFLYSLTVETGQFEIVKHSVLSLSGDRRLQALLIAFCFGAFVEGAAGFGTPVAISSALLVGAGFRPLHAAGLALIANTAPVAFGALGTPIITLAKITLPPGAELAEWEMRLSAMAGRQLPFFSFIVPIWLVWVMAGWRGVRGVWPALLVCGGSFAVVQFLVSNFHGPALVDVIGGVVSLICTALFLRVWKPKEEFHFVDEPPPAPAANYTRGQVVGAWLPWALLTAFVFVWGLPPVKKELEAASIAIKVPALHERVTRTQPVVEKPEPEKAVFNFNWLAATGTGIFLAAVASALWLRVSPARFVRIFATSLRRLAWPLVTIATMLAIAYTTRYSGIDATLGLAFTRTGVLYPLFAAMLGWLGVALTGSDTSSNALFGSLQTITARRLVATGVLPLSADQAMVLLASANSTGGVMGKMIDAQSIVVAAAATQQHGQEGPILRFVFWHSKIMADHLQFGVSRIVGIDNANFVDPSPAQLELAELIESDPHKGLKRLEESQKVATATLPPELSMKVRGKVLCVAMGRRSSQKLHDVVAEAVRIALTHEPKLPLFVYFATTHSDAGSGPRLERIKKLCDEFPDNAGWSDGRVPFFPQLMAAGSYNLLCSLWEPHGGAFEATIVPIARAVDGLAAQVSPLIRTGIAGELASLWHSENALPSGLTFREDPPPTYVEDLRELLEQSPSPPNLTSRHMAQALSATLTQAIDIRVNRPHGYARMVLGALRQQSLRSWLMNLGGMLSLIESARARRE